jgi:hypothetical protein
VSGDILDAQALRAAIPGDVDAVFHVAGDTQAWRPRDTAQTRTNVEGTRTGRRGGARAGREAPRAHVDGIGIRQAARRVVRDDAQQRRAVVDQLRAQQVALGRGGAQGRARRTAGRSSSSPCAIFGPYDTSVWGKVFKIIRDGKMPALPPGSLPINHAVEVARAHVAAAQRGRSGENYILNGYPEPLARIFREMARLMGIELKAKVLPRPVFMAMGHVAGWVARVRHIEPDMTPEMADVLCRQSRVETDKAERELGYQRVPLETMPWRQLRVAQVRGDALMRGMRDLRGAWLDCARCTVRDDRCPGKRADGHRALGRGHAGAGGARHADACGRTLRRDRCMRRPTAATCCGRCSRARPRCARGVPATAMRPSPSMRPPAARTTSYSRHSRKLAHCRSS